MRKISGRILLALGGFLLVLGVLTTVWAPGAVKKTPIDVDSTTHLSGEATKLGETFPINVTSKTKTDTDASTESTAVWVNTSCVVNASDPSVPECVDGSDPRLVSASLDTFATDRVSALAVDSDALPADSVRHEGLVNKWPFDAEKKTYKYWEGTLGQAVDVGFVGEESLLGLDVYHYSYQVTDGAIEIADNEGTYTNKVDIFVEPKTGSIVNQTQDQQRFIVGADGTETQVLDLQAGFTEDQIEKSVEDAKESASKLTLMTRTMPLVGFIGGAIALLAGLLLLRGTRSASQTGASSREHAAAV